MPLEGIWLPPSVNDPLPKRYLCHVCEREWPAHQKAEWGRHVVACADRNSAGEAEVEAMEESIYTSIYDKEHFRFLRNRGTNKPLRRRRRSK